jgi:hypothetical protein
MMPGAISGAIAVANDSNLKTTPEVKYAVGGDFYDLNRFERPFTQNDMNYLPAVDIVNLRIAKDATWYYASMELAGPDPTTNSLNADYALEVDWNRDGRGDLLIWARPLYTTDWSTTPVTVYKDANGDVGGTDPLRSDAPSSGDGYETVIFNGGQGTDPDLAWVRIAPDMPNTIQFAFKLSILEGVSTYLVNGRVDAGIKDPPKFNYNDFFTLPDAGSPLHNDANYPEKAVYSVDNTCRLAVGFTANGSEPLVCAIPVFPTSVGPTPPTPTSTREIIK